MDRAYEMVTILLDALAKANMGDPEGAQRDFERAFAIDGTDPYLRKTYEDALLRIFDHYMERGETEKIEILKERSRRLLGDR
ncbi:MAG: hypothetical protein D6795_08115 [Deltaproteobacteria bacterium]|nr:MAG: hypothetical protein D6795_08115 [Deltaproteobacteria bacterium]